MTEDVVRELALPLGYVDVKVCAVDAVWSGLKLKLGTINDPGAGFVLFYTGILMCLFAASIIIAALTEGGPTFGSRWVNTRWTKPLLVIVLPLAQS